jgi:acyl carrier protein
VAAIWAQLIHLEQVGSEENFFDLGGHSLAAARVIARVVESFQLDLPLKALLDAPTVAEMAQVLMENEAKQVTEKDLGRILDEIEALSEDEAQRRVAKEMVPKGI